MKFPRNSRILVSWDCKDFRFLDDCLFLFGSTWKLCLKLNLVEKLLQKFQLMFEIKLGGEVASKFSITFFPFRLKITKKLKTEGILKSSSKWKQLHQQHANFEDFESIWRQVPLSSHYWCHKKNLWVQLFAWGSISKNLKECISTIMIKIEETKVKINQ